ncbi:MAG: hypothetical protein ACHBN1_25805 [Heteroscytonema crispum UTEX LB 1556]
MKGKRAKGERETRRQGRRAWDDGCGRQGEGKKEKGKDFHPMPNSQCPMPNSQFPMPNCYPSCAQNSCKAFFLGSFTDLRWFTTQI